MALNVVVFDLDGTLVDTLPDLHAALHRLLGERGLATPDAATVRRMIGDGARRLVERALTWSAGAGAPTASPGLDATLLDAAHRRFLDIYNAAPCRDSRLFANVEPMLDRLLDRGFTLGVCTNKPQRPTEAILAELGLARRFGSVIGGDAVARRKPHPDHLLAVLTALGKTPDAAVMIGDSNNDLLAAKACDMPCVLVDFGYSATPVEGLGAEVVIGDFAQLEAELAALASRS